MKKSPGTYKGPKIAENLRKIATKHLVAECVKHFGGYAAARKP